MNLLSEFWVNFFLDETDQVDKINLFGLSHIFLLLSTLAIGIFMYIKREQLKQWKWKEKFRYVLAALFFVNMLFLYLFFILKGVYSWKLHLPLHLCFISGYLLMYVLITGNQKLFRAVYFFTWVGPLPAMIWPNTPMRADRFLSYQFVISHHILLLAGLYCLFVLEYPVTFKDIKRAFLLGNIIFVSVFVFNNLFGTNYIMTNTLPPHIIKLFPFLQYLNIPILWLEICGIAMMFLAYIPARILNHAQRKHSVSSDRVKANVLS